jgi:hypothetical protein
MIADAAIYDALLTNAERAREVKPATVKVCRCRPYPASFAVLAEEFLQEASATARVLLLALPIITSADADAALSVIGSHGDDTELREHLVCQLAFFLPLRECQTVSSSK